MPKIVTVETRTREALDAASAIRTATTSAPQSEAEWAAVAEAAGKLQRKARQLAGLGRGG